MTEDRGSGAAREFEPWPALAGESWKGTYATVHMLTQIVGKVKLTLTPLTNHWWNVAFYLTARGLTTGPMPHDWKTIEVQFDFIAHQLAIQTSDGATRTLRLEARPVADYYSDFMATLHSLGIDLTLYPKPVEIADPIPFPDDRVHASYDPDAANRLWRILASSDVVFKEFRSRFIGKCSPVHLFWGGFDLAVSRFSGRRAPERPGADAVTREGYSHEVSSAGFWPGSGEIKDPAFYSYCAPEPPGFAQQRVRPEAAFYRSGLGLFLLLYDDVRRAESPKQVLLDFLQSTYEAAANLGNWDRKELER
ncbi:MAG TPA: DUF5996 family protein [Thermoanaerobaculia bacterium]|nr:DUF5996 family protein [Thermoanaerobaculia bacterium]